MSDELPETTTITESMTCEVCGSSLIVTITLDVVSSLLGVGGENARITGVMGCQHYAQDGTLLEHPKALGPDWDRDVFPEDT